jgi:hypothetical protein
LDVFSEWNIYELPKEDLLCLDCYNKEDDSNYTEDDFEECGCCGILFSSGFFYTCNKCNMGICTNGCVAITACQTMICTCRSCFDYLCEECKKNPVEQPDNAVFLDDAEPIPICEACSAEPVTEDEDE